MTVHWSPLVMSTDVRSQSKSAIVGYNPDVSKVSSLKWSIFFGQNADLTSGRYCTNIPSLDSYWQESGSWLRFSGPTNYPVMSTFRDNNGGNGSAATSNASTPFGNRKQLSFMKPDKLWHCSIVLRRTRDSAFNHPRGLSRSIFLSQRVIQDRILGMTPVNGIVSQFKTSNAADGMTISPKALGDNMDSIIPSC